MRVEVLLFGPQAAAAGARVVAVEVASPASASGVRSALSAACPALTPSLGGSRLAVNRAIAADDTPVSPGDEVALIGMVSGG